MANQHRQSQMLFQGAIVDDDDIGHGRPPKRTQFKPGVSGNPKGRPKRKPADVSEVIKDALSGNISIIQQRLSAISLLDCVNSETRDRAIISKRPLLAGISRIYVVTISGCFNAWLGREDSNLRMVESKSTALPLGDAPISCPGKRQDEPRCGFLSATTVYRGS